MKIKRYQEILYNDNWVFVGREPTIDGEIKTIYTKGKETIFIFSSKTGIIQKGYILNKSKRPYTKKVLFGKRND